MKKQLRAAFLLLLTASQAFSQSSETEKFKKFKMADFQLAGFFTTYSPQLVDYTTITKLAANVADLNLPTNIDSYIRRQDSQEGSQGTVAIQASIALNPFNKKKGEYNEQHTWRLGLTYRDINTFESSYNISVPTGIDTVSESRDYFVNAGQSALLFETSYSLSSDAKRPVYAYAGLGAQFGISVASNLEVNNNRTVITAFPDGQEDSQFEPSSVLIKGNSSMLWSTFISAGAHIRVRKNLGVLTEVRYAFSGNNSSAAGVSYTRQVIYAGVGLRYTLGAFEESSNSDSVY
ncbi:MAG: hypothetical protein KDC13_08435 [Bacteroidetes bacterium]|nr:hypothetical protein [Bacteroidota bacterium]